MFKTGRGPPGDPPSPPRRRPGSTGGASGRSSSLACSRPRRYDLHRRRRAADLFRRSDPMPGVDDGRQPHPQAIEGLVGHPALGQEAVRTGRVAAIAPRPDSRPPMADLRDGHAAVRRLQRRRARRSSTSSWPRPLPQGERSRVSSVGPVRSAGRAPPDLTRKGAERRLVPTCAADCRAGSYGQTPRSVRRGPIEQPDDDGVRGHACRRPNTSDDLRR